MRLSPFETNPARIAEAVADLQRKRSGTVTLTANATSTRYPAGTALDPVLKIESVVSLVATNANSAAALATTFVTASRGYFTITHANNAQTDRVFLWSDIGS